MAERRRWLVSVRGTRLHLQAGRRSETFGKGRVCEECDTGLNKYNPHPTLCYLHAPLNYGRIRGVPRTKVAS